ncbi:hypothetical protein EXIGLDRAFT_733051 [Exidia glandulosa HHB12029]|uniref:Uncharacterized protein n=1 Tax=Exidia glandulosa HHB12029 TaxID=1314781 RepID=A0A165BDQ7_EXIGL|nr:hypothetical protein EXIGLDRAFT_733051 [Exidia glandulosa HHB12029]
MDYAEGIIEDMADQKVYPPPEEPLDTDFKKKYPPDPLGREMDDAARVWKVYRDEAKAHDETMLDGWNISSLLGLDSHTYQRCMTSVEHCIRLFPYCLAPVYRQKSLVLTKDWAAG